MSARNNELPLGTSLSHALRQMRAAHLPFVSTPAATRLEFDLAPFYGDDAGDAAQRIQHLEGDGLSSIPVAMHVIGEQKKMRYFLDGVQRTLPIGWCGMNALALVVVVAGVIERRPQDGVFRAVPGMLRIASQVLLASAPADPHATALADTFAAAGIGVTRCGEPNGVMRAGDFLALQSRIRPAVNGVRQQCEFAAFQAWNERTDGSEGWLVMDGSLVGSDIGNAVGIIKRHSRFDLKDDEMTALLRLPVGFRSSAFQRQVRGGQRPTTWYLRLHEATGADPLFGLARIEAPTQTTVPDGVDDLSRLLLSERTPRATSDDRWPTLIYPIHIAERILKVKLERALLGVPAALQRYLREAA